jgi:regulatory protein
MENKITALKVQKRNLDRINVFVDGEFAFGISRMAGAWLEIGQELSLEKIRELQAADGIEVAYQKALHFLSFRIRSENEIRRNLRKHKISDDVISDVIERLRRNHLVNDSEFARSWVANRSEFRPRGRRALQAELRQKGIENEIIDDALQTIDEDELAYRAALKQTRKYIRLEWPEYRKKMSAFLARRGFNYGTVFPIVERVWSEEHASTKAEN